MGFNIDAYAGLKLRDRIKAIADPNIFVPELATLANAFVMRPLKMNEPYTYTERDSFYADQFTEWIDSIRLYVSENKKENTFTALLNIEVPDAVIGPIACKITYRDFISCQQGYEIYIKKLYPLPIQRLFLSNYKQWTGAFKTASHTGAIVFC